MITAAAQAIRDYKRGCSGCCYMPGTLEHHTYWKTMDSIKSGTLIPDTNNPARGSSND